jgi:hypothetical protein
VPEYHAGMGGGNRVNLIFGAEERGDSQYGALDTDRPPSSDPLSSAIAIFATILSAENVGCSKRIKATEYVIGFL